MYSSSVKKINKIWPTPNKADSLQAFRLNKKDIKDIISLQEAVHAPVQNSFERIFLKKRDASDYEHIFETGGLVLGIKNKGQLIASACVNNAIDKGRVEIIIDSQRDSSQIGVYQGSMVHPDFRGYDCANGLYIQRALWAQQNDKKQLFASACSHVTNPKTGEEHSGNMRVIHALQNKGWMLTNNTSKIKDDGLELTISNLSLNLPDSEQDLYTHFNAIMSPESVKKWGKAPLLNIV